MNDNNGKKININNSEVNETDILMKQLDLLSFTEDKSFEELISFQKNKNNNNINGQIDLIDNFYQNLQHQKSKEKDISKINYNENENFEDFDKKEILKLKLDNILSSLRLSDIRINIKFYSSLLKFNDYFKDNILISKYFEHFNDLFNIIIELLFIIKKEYEKNEYNIKNNKNNKNGIIMKLEKEINYKEKQIQELLDKLKIEKLKMQKYSKDNANELEMLKKENKELNYQISIYKNQNKKIDANNIKLEEKLNEIIMNKLNKRSSSVSKRIISDTNNKTINMNTNININNFNGANPSTPIKKTDNNNEINNNSNNPSNKDNNNNPSNKDNNNNANNNDKIQEIKKINLNLINSLKELNKMLEILDITLNDDNQKKTITNFNNMNILGDFDKIDSFYKSFLGNRDKILIKIVKLIEINERIHAQNLKDKNNNYPRKYGASSIDKKSSKKINKEFLIKVDEKNENKILVNKKNLSNKK